MADRSSLTYALIVILFWSTSAAVIKLCLSELSSVQFLFWEVLFMAVGLFLVLVFQKKLHLLKSYTLGQHLRLLFLGALGIFLYEFLFILAIDKASAAQANILNYTWPIWIVIFSFIFLKEKLGLRAFIGIALSFIGVVIVLTKGSMQGIAFGALSGSILALLGAVCWGLFSVLSKKMKFEAFSSMFYYAVYGFFFVLILALLKEGIVLPSAKGLAGTFYIGAVTAGVGYALWIKALGSGKTHFVANLAYLTPFLSLVVIYFLIGEKMHAMQLVGLAVIVLGILVQKR